MTVTLAEAHRIIEGAIAKARELKAEISVTACDANGRLIALNRMDGARAEAIGSPLERLLSPPRPDVPVGRPRLRSISLFGLAPWLRKGCRSSGAKEVCRLSAGVCLTALVVSAGPITMRKMKGVLVRGW